MTSPVVEAMLDDVLGLIATRRQRTPVEAPPHLTGGYALLIVAVGFARVGLDARARVVWDQALTGFGDVRRDPVHAWLLDAYATRIAHAIARFSPRTAWPQELATRYAALERPERYKIDRLREASPSLESRGGDQKLGDYLPDGAMALSTTAPIATSTSLDALLSADETTAIGQISQLRPAELSQPQLGAALGVIARFGFAELAPPLIAHVDPKPGARILAAVRALRRLGLDDALASLHSLEARAARGNEKLRKDTPNEVGRLTTRTPSLALDFFRRIAGMYSTSPSELVRDDLRRLHMYWAHASDAFGTNSHFTLAALHVVDSLVSAIVDHHLMSLSPRDDDPAVSWPYLL